MGTGKGKGRVRERKGKGNEKERKGKGNGIKRERKGKVITLISAVSLRFEMVSKYRNKPKDVIIFFRKKYRNRTETASVLVRTERKKIRFAGHPIFKAFNTSSHRIVASVSQLCCNLHI